MSRRLPRLCYHSAAKQFYVRIGGRQVYLGADEAQAEAERLRVLAEWQASGQIADPGGVTTVNMLAAAYLQQHVEPHYRRPDGTPTSEVQGIRMALRPLLALYGGEPVERFGPLALGRVRDAMASGAWKADQEGWCLNTVNQCLARLKRLFRWGVSQELVPETVWRALETVATVPTGRGLARETAPVGPPSEAAIAAVRADVNPTIRDMIDVQLLTGCRPGELCAMRPRDIDRTGQALRDAFGLQVQLTGVWAYLPGVEVAGDRLRQQHKTAHHGHRRIIPIGPAAQAILAKYLEGRAPDAKLFGYVVTSYSRRIRESCLKLELAEPWHCHQLRHAAASRLVRQFGEQIAAIVLGHQTLAMTRRYSRLTAAEIDLEKAFRAMGEAG